MQRLAHKSNRIGLAAQCIAVFAFVFTVVVPLQPAEARTRPDDAAKLANWYYKWSIDSKKEAKELAEWDVLIIDIESEYYSRDRLKQIKKLNPDIKLLAYISMTDIRPDAADLDVGTTRQKIGEMLEENPEYILRDSSGNPVHWWENYYIFNIAKLADKGSTSNKKFRAAFPRMMNNRVIKDKIWDGIFYDNLWEGASFINDHIDLDQDGVAESTKKLNKQWKKGTEYILKKTRSYAKKAGRKNFIITGNGGTAYNKKVNGVGFEHFPNTVYGDWVDSMGEYYFILNNAVGPEYVFINTNVQNSGDRYDYKKFRYGLMSALLSDGYYHFDDGDQSHTQRWYYDEYDISLGEATSGAYNLLDSKNPTERKEGVWRRDYEEASVIVNSTGKDQRITLNTGFEKINGTQDTSTNDGSVIGSITVPSEDGILLLRRLTAVRDATFINGAFSKVFSEDGEQVRKSFFASAGSFPGNTQIHRVTAKKSGNNRTVVADDTWVRVYNNRNQVIAQFAPYGEGYSDGVNISVGKLYGGNKSYIVTGNKKGRSHVRIWDMKGNLVNNGCYPYDNFQGGVNVGIGDLNGDKKQEIVVAAGYGGGPHVRVLSNDCNVINPGFFAYEEHLRIGVNMTVGDVNGDGKAEIITSAGPGGGPHIRIFNRKGKLINPGFFAYSTSDRSGVLVSAADIDKDGTDEIITSSFGIFNSF